MSKPQRLEIQDVTKHFGGVRALDGVSLDVQPGELVSILGASGCGKSTLLRVRLCCTDPSDGFSI